MAPFSHPLARLINIVLLVSLITALCPPARAHAQSPSALVRYEDSSSAISVTGTWSNATVATMSGGSVRQSKTTNSTLTLSFTGPWVLVGFRTTNSSGKVALAIDGSSQGILDTYSPVSYTHLDVYKRQVHALVQVGRAPLSSSQATRC